MAKRYIPHITEIIIKNNDLIIKEKSDNLADMIEWMEIFPRKKLYSPAFGIVRLSGVDRTKGIIQVEDKSGQVYNFTLEGKLHEGGEVVLFPDENKVWNPVAKKVYPPRKKTFEGLYNSNIETYKLLEFLVSAAEEINSFYDMVYESKFPDYSHTNREVIYIIVITSSPLAISYRQVKLDEYYYNSNAFPPFFCFNTFSALLYFLHEYNREMIKIIPLIFKDFNHPCKSNVYDFTPMLKSYIEQMFPPYR